MSPVGGAGAVPETIAVAGAAMLAPADAAGAAASAISPGMITRNGNSAFGIAAISGVRRAAAIESAAIARWTTRKSVHQYPNDNTNPRPIDTPNTSTPSGLVDALAMPRHECVSASGIDWRMPDQPPTSLRPRYTSGTKPATIRKNCSTSL